MRKLMVGFFLFGLSAVSADFVDHLPNGHFAGNGTWSDNLDNAGSYATYVEILNNDMRVDYSWEDQSMTIFLSFWFYGPGVFDVIYQGGQAGSGFCDENNCYYDLTANGLHYSETLTFNHDADGSLILSKVGEKQVGDRIVQWQDGLYYVNLGEENPIILPVPENDQTQH